MAVGRGAGDLGAKGGSAERKISYSALFKLVDTRNDKSRPGVLFY